MLTSDKALDMLPIFVDIYDKLDMDTYRKKAAEENKGKELDQMGIGIDGFKFILRNSAKVKGEILEIVAAFEGKTVEEVKKQNFLITIKSFKEVFSDKEAIGFFKDAVR